MSRSGEREQFSQEPTAASSGMSGGTPGADDLTLARLAATGERGDAAAELTERHAAAVLAYAGQCAAAPRAAALLAAAATDAALLPPRTGRLDSAWRLHALACVLRTAAEWLQDERRLSLDGELVGRLPGLVILPEPDDPQPAAVTAFNRMPVRFQVALWHVVVEKEHPEAVAPHLGVDAGVVRMWVPTAEEQFRRALIEVYEESAAPACRPFSRILVSASETDPTRAVATRASSGLDEHLAGCADCTRSLDELTRLNGPERGASLAEVLLPWGGIRYLAARAADAADGRSAASSAPGRAPVRRASGRVFRSLRGARRQRAVLIPLGVCTAVTVVIACVATPRFEETGDSSRPRDSGDIGLLTHDAASSSLPSPRSTGHHKVHEETGQAKKTTKEKDGKKTDKGKSTDHSGSTTGPTQDVTAPSPSPSALAVPGAALRWDFSADAQKEPGPHPPAYVGDVKRSTDRDGSLTCDGGGYLQTGGAVVDTSGSFTVSAWVRLTSKSGFQTVAGQDGRNVSGFFLQYSDTDDRWRLALGHSDSTDADETQVLSAHSPVLNQWQHLTAVVDAGARQIRLYVNGVLQGAANDVNRWSAEGPFSVGRGLWDGQASDAWHGGIDDVRVYTRALGASEARYLAAAGPNA
ncbi:LamG domain-containing protein [Streptomyces sp. NPDC093223]|uniref:LamG domain-containing protein n=1 Tax=Streptomyces sp. NPDC093223 TaxID=3366033 RepID=UPI00380EB6BE